MNVLLVDDEPLLLQLLGQHLTRQGHTVESAANVSEALALALTARPVPFDFALIDWTLPDGNGLDAAQQILAHDPKVRVVFTSGYPLDIGVVSPSVRDRVKVLQKPFLPRALAEMMNSWQL